jgi:microcystin degradation protein MlrC
VRPVSAVFDCRAIAGFMTSREPGRGFVDRIKALEGRDGILSISVAHGFQAADVYDVGTKVLVIADGDLGQGGGAGRDARARDPRLGAGRRRRDTTSRRRRSPRRCGSAWPAGRPRRSLGQSGRRRRRRFLGHG